MRPTRILPIILLLTACAPAAPVPTTTPLPPTVTVTTAPTSTSTMEPTATEAATNTPVPTATASPTPTEVLVVLPAELAAQVDKLTDAQRKNLGGKAEDTRWKVDVYNAIKSGSPNLKLALGIWENPGADNDVEVVYKLPSDPSVIYLPGTKLWADHSLPPAEITEEMMHNQEVVGKYTQVVTKAMEQKNGLVAGSRLARVNGDLVYISNKGIEAKLNPKTNAFEFQLVRNAEGQVPLEDGIKVKVTNIKTVSNEGVFTFSAEADGTIPFPDAKIQWPKLPEGYEYTAVVMEGFGAKNNNMVPWGENAIVACDGGTQSEYQPKYVRSEGTDSKWARVVIVVPHKIGDTVKSLALRKTKSSAVHVVYTSDDLVTKDLLPR